MKLFSLKNLLMSLTFTLSATLLFIVPTPQVQAAQPKKDVKKFPRGHILPSKDVLQQRHRTSNSKYGVHLRSLPIASQASYDAYNATGGSCVPPIGDQGPCGNCYDWSGTKLCSAAQMAAGVVKAGSKFMLSVQWSMDYHPELGGCDGGDEYQVAQIIQSGGAPSVADYPGAGQGPGQKKPTTGMTLYTVSSLVYCDPNQTDQGVASIQSIKNCVLAYSYVSVAVAAGNDWDSYGGGTLTGNSTSINHAVGITGWDDNHDNGDGTKGAWLLDNQWGTSWGNNGRAWIKYGAEQVGTEAFVALVNAPPPPPPLPIPPTPPAPPPPTGAGFTGTLTYSNGVLTTITPGGTTPTVTLQDDLTSNGVNPAVIVDVLQLVTDLKNKAGFATIALDVAKIISDFGAANPPTNSPGLKTIPKTSWEQFSIPQEYTVTNTGSCSTGTSSSSSCALPSKRPTLFSRIRNR